MKFYHKLTLIKWDMQNYLLKIEGKQPVHYPTKQYEELLKQLKLDKYIQIVNKSYSN